MSRHPGERIHSSADLTADRVLYKVGDRQYEAISFAAKGVRPGGDKIGVLAGGLGESGKAAWEAVGPVVVRNLGSALVYGEPYRRICTADRMEHLAGLLGHLGQQKTVIAHSWGLIAAAGVLEAADNAADDLGVDGLISLAGAGITGPYGHDKMVGQVEVASLAAKELLRSRSALQHDADMRVASLGVTLSTLSFIANKGPRSLVRMGAEIINSRVSADLLPLANRPDFTLQFIGGTDDPLFPGDLMADQLFGEGFSPNQVTTLPGVGHTDILYDDSALAALDRVLEPRKKHDPDD